MPVNFDKTREILVVHGVQNGTDEQINNDEVLKENLQKRAAHIGLDLNVSIYKYENVNDLAQARFREFAQQIGKDMQAKKIGDLAMDLVGDVLINLKDGSTAHQIRGGLAEKIMDNYINEIPTYVLAHSLGSIYSFDVVNEFMQQSEFYRSNEGDDWPVQGLMTIGSPIGLDLFNDRKLTPINTGDLPFAWKNVWDRTDPIVTAQLFGLADSEYDVARKFQVPNTNWRVSDVVIDSGLHHFPAHFSYWEDGQVADDLITLVTE